MMYGSRLNYEDEVIALTSSIMCINLEKLATHVLTFDLHKWRHMLKSHRDLIEYLRNQVVEFLVQSYLCQKTKDHLCLAIRPTLGTVGRDHIFSYSSK